MRPERWSEEEKRLVVTEGPSAPNISRRIAAGDFRFGVKQSLGLTVRGRGREIYMDALLRARPCKKLKS